MDSKYIVPFYFFLMFAPIIAGAIAVFYMEPSETALKLQEKALQKKYQQHKLRSNYFSYYAVSPCTAEGIAKK